MNGSRGSTIGKGDGIINSVTIDTLTKMNIPTYIKMDIEGAEALAIKCGENTIINHKPKMQIAAYHRSEDLFDIPERIYKCTAIRKLFSREYSPREI